MVSYLELKEKHQKEYNEFSEKNIFYAFSNEQFEEGLKKLGFKFGVKSPKVKEKITTLYGAGDYIPKSKVKDLKDLWRRQDEERKAAIKADKDGNGYCYEMWLYELNNHEYGYTYDPTDAMKALGLTFADLEKKENTNVKAGFEKAKKKILGED